MPTSSAGGASSSAQAAGPPEGTSTGAPAKDHQALVKKRDGLKKELQSIEQQIFELEGSYLEETRTTGNVLVGWVLSLPAGGAHKKEAARRITKDDRLFSLSSVTAPMAAHKNARAVGGGKGDDSSGAPLGRARGRKVGRGSAGAVKDEMLDAALPSKRQRSRPGRKSKSVVVIDNDDDDDNDDVDGDDGASDDESSNDEASKKKLPSKKRKTLPTPSAAKGTTAAADGKRTSGGRPPSVKFKVTIKEQGGRSKVVEGTQPKRKYVRKDRPSEGGGSAGTASGSGEVEKWRLKYSSKPGPKPKAALKKSK